MVDDDGEIISLYLAERNPFSVPCKCGTRLKYTISCADRIKTESILAYFTNVKPQKRICIPNTRK